MSPSNGWEDILITSSINPIVLKIMQSVYRHRNLLVPLQLDMWWNRPCFTYKVEENSSQPSADQPKQRLHFMVFVNQQTDFASPDDIAHDLLELQNVALRHALERQRNILRVRQLMAQNEQAAEQKKEEAIQSFYRRLVEHRAIEQHALPSPPEYACPVCKTPETLVKCVHHSSDGLKVCTEHQETRFCRSCIGAGDGVKLRPCPVATCDQWTCKKDWTWCFGRPIHIMPSDTENSSNISSRKGKQKATAPAHPPALAPCPNHQEFLWTKCSARGCWSKKSCEAQPGHKTCSNQCTWICAACAFKKVRPIWNCPSCDAAFCNHCGMAKRCIGCGKSEWCLICRGEEEESDEESKPTGRLDTGSREKEETKFEWTCSICKSALCETCSRNTKLGLFIVCESCDEACCRGSCREEIVRCSDCADHREAGICCDAPCTSEFDAWM
ncbi:hypothetical protein IW261DRAFT_1475295 [Armillaria novae-zelandiae]|uniref:Uncharacterized protein n=1 Tax=Armillaria novae-zelandiae TaxID=153914 RepID=A0AA39PB29_9AGAR|nr:hypothetical protein IW261DRAFT_1475295 [Armillaria novae-zelandiae]